MDSDQPDDILNAGTARMVPAPHFDPPQGARVTITAKGPMGLLESPDESRFSEKTVSKDDEGIYIGRHPTLADWHIVAFDIEGMRYYCPMAEGTFHWVAE